MSKNSKATILFSLFVLFAWVTATSAWAGKNQLEQRGRFGITYYDNFITLEYSITYLGDSFKPGHLSFQFDFEDTKGFDLSREVVESECKLKNVRNQKLSGKVERVSDDSFRIHFPFGEDFKKDGKMKLYAVIRDYKLMKTFGQHRSSYASK